MALEMKPTSRWWYARLRVGGKLRRFPLLETRNGQQERLEILGRRPPSITQAQMGDAAFQESLRRALAAHDRLVEAELAPRRVEDFVQRLAEAKTGSRVDFVKVADLASAWAAIPRKREPSAKYADNSKSILRRFSGFMARRFPAVEDLISVRGEHLRDFLEAESERGISARTWNVSLTLLKTVFRRLEPNADASRSFLKDVLARDEDTIHRAPFNEDELAAVLRAAREDEILRGPVITAICTGMRRGDCTLLKWPSVDLAAGFIEVTTSKTGERAEIPILPLLREELSRTPRGGSEFVFPAAAELYLKNPHGLNRGLRMVLARAGFVDAATAARLAGSGQAGAAPPPGLEAAPPGELRRRGLEAIAKAAMIEARRERMREVFKAYLAGKSVPGIARDFGLSKSTVSIHLNEIEKLTGLAVLRRPAPTPAPAVVRGRIHADPSTGRRLKRGSIRGWHSLRTTFITRALGAGLPEELLRRITGHSAVDTVRKFYFRPGRELFKREFEKAMPGLLLSGAAQPPGGELRAVIEAMPPSEQREAALNLLNNA